MAEIERVETLEDGGVLEYWDDGRIQAKDSNGKFAKHPANCVPSDVARRVSQGRTLKAKATRGEDVAAILIELGLDPGSKANRGLAELFLAGGSGAVGALRELKRAAGGTFQESSLQSHTVEAWPILDVIRVDNVLFRRLDAPELLEIVGLLQQEKERRNASDAKDVAESAE